MARNLERFTDDEQVVQEKMKYLPDIKLDDVKFLQVANFKPEDVDELNPLQQSLIRLLPSGLTWTTHERQLRPKAFEAHKRDKSSSPPRHLSIGIEIIGSAIVALFAGACIIAPMIFMSIRPDHSKNLGQRLFRWCSLASSWLRCR